MKKAFSLLELVVVIVVVGILAAAIIPRTESNRAHEAAMQVVNDIRYTQHLAMLDDKFNPADNEWFKKRWTILFNSDQYTCNKIAYTIFQDLSGTGNPDLTSTVIEVARDPQNANIEYNKGQFLSGGFSGENDLDFRNLQECGGSNPEKVRGNKKYNLGLTYGISSIKFSSSCSYYSSQRISFDHVGRPIYGKLSSYTESYEKNRIVRADCEIQLQDDIGETVTIVITPETGYTYIKRT